MILLFVEVLHFSIGLLHELYLRALIVNVRFLLSEHALSLHRVSDTEHPYRKKRAGRSSSQIGDSGFV